MSRFTALFLGTVVEAEDGCGPGWYFNRRATLPTKNAKPISNVIL